MTPEQLRYNALVVMLANLQRLHVFQQASAIVAGVPADPVVLGELRAAMDDVSAAIGRADASGTVADDDAARLRPIAGRLADGVRAYYRTDLSGPLRTQVAFGAAAVAAAGYLNRGTVRMGEVFGREDWADRHRQHGPRLDALRRQADAAVRAAAAGEPDGELADAVRYHVRVAREDEQQALAQVDGLPALLDGRDPRTVQPG